MKWTEYDVASAKSSHWPTVKASTVVAPDIPPLHEDGADRSLPPTKDHLPHQSSAPKTPLPTRKYLATPYNKTSSKESASSLKRSVSPRPVVPKKRVRVSAAASKPAKVVLPNHPSIDDINMPQSPQVVRLPNGEPDSYNLPWAGVDYENSMVVYWHDEKKKTNPVAAELFAKKFKKKVPPESVRRRHVRVVQKLANNYGLKPGVQIAANDTVDSLQAFDDDTSADVATAQVSVSSNGIQAAAKSVAVSTKRQTQSRDIEKQEIVNLRLSDLYWPEIRDKLELKYKWSLGIPTIKKYFDEKRAELTRTRKAAANQAKEAALSNAKARTKVEADVKAEPEARAALQARADALFARPTSFNVRRRSI